MHWVCTGGSIQIYGSGTDIQTDLIGVPNTSLHKYFLFLRNDTLTNKFNLVGTFTVKPAATLAMKPAATLAMKPAGMLAMKPAATCAGHSIRPETAVTCAGRSTRPSQLRHVRAVGFVPTAATLVA